LKKLKGGGASACMNMEKNQIQNEEERTGTLKNLSCECEGVAGELALLWSLGERRCANKGYALSIKSFFLICVEGRREGR